MNRKERRRTEAAKRAYAERIERDRTERQAWVDGVMDFHRATKGAVETYIVHAHECPLLMIGAAYGEPTAMALSQAISIWADAARTSRLCLDCDTVFGPDVVPAAFAVTMPFAEREHAMVTAICRSCVERGEDLQAMALRHYRTIWPDAYRVEGGGHG